jgi:hypothetical protein
LGCPQGVGADASASNLGGILLEAGRIILT